MERRAGKPCGRDARAARRNEGNSTAGEDRDEEKRPAAKKETHQAWVQTREAEGGGAIHKASRDSRGRTAEPHLISKRTKTLGTPRRTAKWNRGLHCRKLAKNTRKQSTTSRTFCNKIQAPRVVLVHLEPGLVALLC